MEYPTCQLYRRGKPLAYTEETHATLAIYDIDWLIDWYTMYTTRKRCISNIEEQFC